MVDHPFPSNAPSGFANRQVADISESGAMGIPKPHISHGQEGSKEYSQEVRSCYHLVMTNIAMV